MSGGKSQKNTTVSLKSATKARLEAYKAKLIGRRQTTKLSFDDIVNEFLDTAEEREKGSK
jgi:hypothetical protein